jgi:CelD/BcsL family acetyltransferase involved in cellulose biosynthesis
MDQRAAAAFAAMREDWDRLALESGDIFATYEWATVWWEHFGRGEPALLPLTHGDRLLGIAPLYVQQRGPLRIVRFIGSRVGDTLGPVCAPVDQGEAGAALLAALKGGAAGPWHALLAERVPIGPLGDALGGDVLQREAAPELELRGTWDEYVAAASKNLREKLKRNTRKLERDHKLEFRLCTERTEVDADFDSLVRLHKLRWSDGGAFRDEAVVDFHREFAQAAFEEGRLRLWSTLVDGEAVAAWYGFRYAGTEFYYQSGRDPRWDRFSVGFLMLMRTLQAAFEDGLDRYSFLRGDEPYKSRFTHAGDRIETQAVGNGALASLGIRAGGAALEWPWLRRRVTAAMR